MTIVEGVVAVLGGGFVGALFSYLRAKRSDRRNSLESDNKMLREQIAAQIVRIDAQQAQINTLSERMLSRKMELYELRNKIALLEASNVDSPLPMWVKDAGPDCIMLSANRAYERMFLKPIGKTMQDYLGRSDYSIWPEDTAERFAKNDEYVLRTGKVFDGYETVPVNGKEERWRIIKFPRFAGKTIVAVSGIAIPAAGHKLDLDDDRQGT